MRFSRYVAISATVVAVGLLVGCGGGGSNGSGVVPPASGASAAAPAGGSSGTNPAQSSAVVLSAGSSVTMAANSSVSVPAGTTVRTPDGNTVTVNGSSNTVHTSIGAIIDVPGTATGTATNLVTTVSATGTPANGATTSLAFNEAVLAGSPVDSTFPVDGTGKLAVLSGGGHIVVDPGTNNLLISDDGKLKSVTQAGVVTTLTSTRDSTLYDYFYFDGIALDATHNIYASGRSDPFFSPDGVLTFGSSIWKRDPERVVKVFAPNWQTTANAVTLSFGGMAIDTSRNLFYADAANHQIVKFTPSGVMSVFAGSGQAGSTNGVGIAASFQSPQDIAIDANGNLFVADGDSGVRKITPDGTVSTLAKTKAYAVAVDLKGNVYVADVFNIKRIDSSGNVTTYPVHVGNNPIVSMTCDSSGALYLRTHGPGAQILKVTFN